MKASAFLLSLICSLLSIASLAQHSSYNLMEDSVGGWVQIFKSASAAPAWRTRKAYIGNIRITNF